MLRREKQKEEDYHKAVAAWAAGNLAAGRQSFQGAPLEPHVPGTVYRGPRQLPPPARHSDTAIRGANTVITNAAFRQGMSVERVLCDPDSVLSALARTQLPKPRAARAFGTVGVAAAASVVPAGSCLTTAGMPASSNAAAGSKPISLGLGGWVAERKSGVEQERWKDGEEEEEVEEGGCPPSPAHKRARLLDFE